MSYLQNQLNAFKADVTSVSSKIANKRTLAAPTRSVPSPAPSVASNASSHDAKRRRPEKANTVYQPPETGVGENVMTQIHTATDYIKRKNIPLSFDDIISYLSIQHCDASWRDSVRHILEGHGKIQYDPQGAGGAGSFSYRPMLPIRNGDELLAYLQSQKTAEGVKVNPDLKDGWPDCEPTIDKLETQGKVLVSRFHKENRAKKIWLNDASLRNTIDGEFQTLWHKIRLPASENLAEELEKVNMVPTSKKKEVSQKPKTQEKKRKKPRRVGKTTNKHMENILRDYSK
ncbi:MAG: hypothetical protein M1834_003075 [Cirrosporium novae-zelandiae]|nr:MAG: hypothetical protein M1834_003075 [Cirrosporium novae-zelandiae]